MADPDFYLIRPDGPRYAISPGWRALGIPPIGALDRRADTEDEAVEWASDQPCNYGVFTADDREKLEAVMANPPT